MVRQITNKLIEGENLVVLTLLNRAYAGKSDAFISILHTTIRSHTLIMLTAESRTWLRTSCRELELAEILTETAVLGSL